MFNAGVIASVKQSKYKLTSRELGYASDYSAYYIQFFMNGIFEYSSPQSGIAVRPAGEWAKDSPTSNGNNFQVRATVEAGTGFSTGNAGSWRVISQYVVYGFNNAGGRIFVELRGVTDSVVVASARFWTPGYAP